MTDHERPEAQEHLLRRFHQFISEAQLLINQFLVKGDLADAALHHFANSVFDRRKMRLNIIDTMIRSASNKNTVFEAKIEGTVAFLMYINVSCISCRVRMFFFRIDAGYWPEFTFEIG